MGVGRLGPITPTYCLRTVSLPTLRSLPCLLRLLDDMVTFILTPTFSISAFLVGGQYFYYHLLFATFKLSLHNIQVLLRRSCFQPLPAAEVRLYSLYSFDVTKIHLSFQPTSDRRVLIFSSAACVFRTSSGYPAGRSCTYIHPLCLTRVY